MPTISFNQPIATKLSQRSAMPHYNPSTVRNQVDREARQGSPARLRFIPNPSAKASIRVPIRKPDRATKPKKSISKSRNGSRETRREWKQFKCEQCNVTAADRHKLRRHVSRVHENIRPFECRACGMRFCVRHERNRHEYAKHENMGSFECSTCSERFSRKYLYEKHMQFMHAEEVDKPACDRCGQSFEGNALLIGHRRSKECVGQTV